MVQLRLAFLLKRSKTEINSNIYKPAKRFKIYDWNSKHFQKIGKMGVYYKNNIKNCHVFKISAFSQIP